MPTNATQLKKVMRHMLREYYGIPATGGDGYTYHYVNSGVTKFDEAGGAQTDKSAYIGDKNATTTITGYENAWAFEAQYIPNDPVSKDIRDIAVLQKTGVDCERAIVSIDLSETPTTEGVYTARMCKVAVEATPPAAEPRGVAKMTGNMHQNGDFVEGTFNISTKTFTPTATEA